MAALPDPRPPPPREAARRSGGALAARCLELGEDVEAQLRQNAFLQVLVARLNAFAWRPCLLREGASLSLA